MTENKKYFHFTLGPVQGFVAQARRTRDFWAGSFLLSWLSGVAIQAVQVQGGVIIFPIPDDKFLKAINGQSLPKKPTQGGIPNRFMANISQCDDFDAQAVCYAVRQAWQAVCDSVWYMDKKSLEQNIHTEKIWQQQNRIFWDINWVITADNDSIALDKRKNFRTHVPSVEAGYKCMIMEGYQELSGTSSGKELRDYWQQVLAIKDKGLDLREDERLCAIAYVKRRFVHSFTNVNENIKVGHYNIKVYGWKLPKNVPSVGYMAAVPWLLDILKENNSEIQTALASFSDQVSEYAQKSDKYKQSHVTKPEKNNHVQKILNVFDAAGSSLHISPENIHLDGQVYYANHWNNPNNLYADLNNKSKKVEQQVTNCQQFLAKLYEAYGQKPSPYYAILLMDGDSLGNQMSHVKRQTIIGEALKQFTNKVIDIINKHAGFLVYAGGDDVLALFSLDDALPAAVSLQQCYKNCFENASTDKVKVYSTLSAAINYCHIGNPLTQVLADSHELLDDIAKESTGRNALAVRVWKPSGLAVEWTMPWSKVLDTNAIMQINTAFGLKFDDNTPVIVALASAMGKQKVKDNNISIFSNGFFYKTRELMSRLAGMLLTDEQKSKLLLAEYLQSGHFGKITENERKALIIAFNILLEQSKDYRSVIDDGQASIDADSGTNLSGEAGILLRILGQKGLSNADI